MRTPLFIQKLLPGLTWHIPVSEKVLFLTFDDGPVPGVTPWVLETLAAFRAKATFFCVGDNVQNHTAIYNRLPEEGHRAGNHTMHHLHGWKTSNRDYLRDVEECSGYVKSALFRPPYGKIRPSQARYINKNYRIIMWDVLSRDYDPRQTGHSCLQHVIRDAGPGSIVVFHDSLKAEPRLRAALPGVLEYFAKQGYRFESIPYMKNETPDTTSAS